MNLKGWLRTSLIDYPEHIATVLFTGGCNFRCPACHNAELVVRPAVLPDLPLDEVWGFLARRAGQVNGVVITGGEPTLQPELFPFLRQVQERGFEVKLDTNGYRPDVLAVLLEGGVLNYVALDVKAPPHKYPLLAGLPAVDVARLEQSIALLRDSARNSAVAYEFRTTVVPGLLDDADIEEIARWLTGAEQYVLQQFRPVSTLDPALQEAMPYPAERLRAMAGRAGQWVERVTVRGVPNT